MRVSCVIKDDSSEMEAYGLVHEFAKQPPSLFDKGTMRKNTKSVLTSVLKSKVNVYLQVPDGANFFIDGGHLLQSLPWSADATYINQVRDHYISYVIIDHYGSEVVVVFEIDGYGSVLSTKNAEQQRRVQQKTSADIVFDVEMKTTTAGELFLLKLDGVVQSKSLDKHRYTMYFRSVHRASLSSSSFKLESLPPTSGVATLHSFRTYHTIQQWQGNDLPPIEWGWQQREGMLVPIETDRPVAPEKVLKMISCGCKTGCGKACGCYKAGLECSILCTVCTGLNCRNARAIDVQDDDTD